MATTRAMAKSNDGKGMAIVSRQTSGRWALGFTDGEPGRAWQPVKTYATLTGAKRGAERWIGGHYKGCQWTNG